jgi:hypothetical protein
MLAPAKNNVAAAAAIAAPDLELSFMVTSFRNLVDRRGSRPNGLETLRGTNVCGKRL